MPPVDLSRNVTPDISCIMVGANCHGIVESSLGRGAIELGRARGFAEVGDSGLRIDTSFTQLRITRRCVILRAAINHYIGNIAELQRDLAEIEVLVEMACIESACPQASCRPAYKGVRPRAYRRKTYRLSQSPKLIRLGFVLWAKSSAIPAAFWNLP